MRKIPLLISVVALGLVLAVVLIDYKGPASQASARDQGGVSVVAPAEIESAAMPELQAYQRVEMLMSTPTGASAQPGPSVRVDTSSPQSLVYSLQQIEAAASKEKVDLLRGALIVLQMNMQIKVVKMTKGRPVAPNFNDRQLMDLAFAEINGMTADEIIDYARKLAPSVVPKRD